MCSLENSLTLFLDLYNLTFMKNTQIFLDNNCIFRSIKTLVLCFDLLTRPKMPFKVVHRKEVTHPGHCKSEEVAQALRRVYITAWEFEGNIRPTN